MEFCLPEHKSYTFSKGEKRQFYPCLQDDLKEIELTKASAEARDKDLSHGETADMRDEKVEEPATSGNANNEALDSESGDEGGDGEGADPLQGLSERKKKLYLLKQKLKECRKANQHAVVAENKRKQVRLHRILHGFFFTFLVYNTGF